MKYSVLIINEDGIYETVARGVTGVQAGLLKKALIKKGIWTQVKQEDGNA